MIKLTLSLLALSLISTVSFADPVCHPTELGFDLNDNRYVLYDTAGGTWKFFDTKTIKIDKKTKNIAVWSIELVTPNERNRLSAKTSQFNNLGITQNLLSLDYQNKSMILNILSFLNCDGSFITSVKNNDTNKEEIPPDSIMEVLLEKIMKKYNLK